MEAVAEAAAPASATALGHGGGSDSVVIHPYLYPNATLKVPIKPSPSLGKQLQKLTDAGGSQKAAKDYIASLNQARSSLATTLESTSVSDAAVGNALAEYLGLLQGMLFTAGSSSSNGASPGTAAAEAASPDEALAAAESGTAAGRSLAAPTSRLRNAVQWAWGEAVLAPAPGALPRTSSAADAAYELASVLVAGAVRLMRAAAEASADSASGVPTPASTRAYRLLREAAGMLELVGRDVLPLLQQGVSADCDPQVVQALASVALADAQQLTVLRAIGKGNQPSLVAALAADTAALYGQACAQLGTSAAAGASSCKLWQYGQYKKAYCLAYAHAFNGIALWKAEKPGEGLKSLEGAAEQLAAARRASGAYDASPPASLNLHHRRTDEDLERVITDTQRRMQRENDMVYVQRVAAEVPALPAGKRLVSALPYTLPPCAPAVRDGVVEQGFAAAPAAAATAAPAVQTMHGGAAAGGAAAGSVTAAAAGTATTQGEASSSEQGCSCCRWLCAMICLPVLGLLSVVGAVLWVVLLPLKCCCPCLGFPLQWAIDLMLGLMKLPAQALMWASGADGGGSESKK